MQLLERVADRICHAVMAQHAPVHGVRVHVKKQCIPALTAAVQSIGEFGA